MGLSTGERKIEFVGDTETASVFRLFLKLVSGGQIELAKDLGADIYHLAIFLQKWDCPAHLSNLLRAIAVGMFLDDVSAIDLFFVAAALKDPNTAAIALRSTGWKWVMSAEATGAIVGRSVFDPRGWSLSRHREWQVHGNLEYLWALSRAYDDCSSDLSDLSSKFVEYLALTEGE